MNIFTSLPKGDSAVWSDDPIRLPDNRQAGSTDWALRYQLRGPAVLNLDGVADGAGWKTTLTPAASAVLAAGLYGWSAVITRTGERITVGSGQLTIQADLAAVTAPFDTRTTAQIALAACEAAMATFNSTGGKVKKYEIAGRTMEFQTIGDLMTLHSFWKAKVMSEGAASSIASGLGNPRNLYTRFIRPQ